MTLQHICDLCKILPAEYRIQERMRVLKFGTRFDPWDDVLGICEPCWTAIRAARRVAT